MSNEALTRDHIVAEIRHNASRHNEFSLHAVHDRLCGTSEGDSAYFDKVINQMVSDGEIKLTRSGFARSA